ncbi:DNA ligase D [Clostridium aminobutyricum]|uniref:DNA ligase (ATP) n=1 Tax=Clostridium aminobutyricum TaxID=33953 RepID=A0A939D788_CLOAM|nr:DNA ligase D [Clostridium aminobutyricum]MBN7772381.1 DNA ligase D [Clostridium aminobutyricum]
MTIKLEEYNQKRNFQITVEPEGKAEKPEEHLKFVIQHHLARRDHYDLRLEWDGALLSWAVPKVPSYNTRDRRLAVQVEDHPLEYRNFEGTIPKGEYGGGVVMLWDEGYWEPQMDVEEGLISGSLKFVLKGRRLRGKWALVRMKPKAGEGKNNWLLLKEKDEYANTTDTLAACTTSIRTGRTMTEIEQGENEKIIRNPFDHADVQLAKLVNRIPEEEDWLYEMKYDGYRIIAYVEGSNVRLMTRNGKDYTNRFMDIAYSLADWAAGRPMILDGEMAVTDENGKTDFQALQDYTKNPRGKKLTYILFDLLALDGVDLREQALINRKETLKALMQDAPKNLYYSQHVTGNGKQCFLVSCQSNMEGIVGKKADSVYSGTRNGDWIKLKCDKRQEFVIGGYTLTDKKASGVSSLLLGVYEGEELVYAGRAGTGLTARSMKELEEKFERIKKKTPSFRQFPETRKNEKMTWLEPVLVAEIKFAGWTEDNLLRQASFKGLRADKDPRDIKREKADNETPSDEIMSREELSDNNMEEFTTTAGNGMIIDGIKITNPDKVIFENPVITKLDVVRYYETIAERMLPYVSNRILSIVRCPKGMSQSCFFKKHPAAKNKAIVTIPVTNSNGETEDYFYIENTSGLVYEAQMGTLEFHTWGSRADNLEKPDRMVFDLDPDEGMNLETVRQGVKDVKSILQELSLISFLKTSGGKGYHVVVPFEPSVDWETFYDFAKRIAVVMEQKWPDRYTSNVRKANRKNKIFIDWIRNGRGATSIAPYSIRAREGARVSMPITWEELDTVAPDGINMAEALSRMNGMDPWKDFFQIDQRLK